MRYILTIILLSFPIIATSSDWKDISGIYAVTAESLIDPGEDDPSNSHYRIQLKGDSAKALFQAMNVEPRIDECTGASAKSIGEMQCLLFENSGTYECHFSINIDEQTIEYGVVC